MSNKITVDLTTAIQAKIDALLTDLNKIPNVKASATIGAAQMSVTITVDEIADQIRQLESVLNSIGWTFEYEDEPDVDGEPATEYWDNVRVKHQSNGFFAIWWYDGEPSDSREFLGLSFAVAMNKAREMITNEK